MIPRLYKHLSRTGYRGRGLVILTCYLCLLVLWLSVCTAMVVGSLMMIEANRPPHAGSGVKYPLQSVTKSCKADADECYHRYGHCYCLRMVYCHLNFGHLSTQVLEHKRYTRCYPEKCLTGDFCNFVIGYNYTLWPMDNSEWTIISPDTYQTGFILGITIVVMVLLVMIPVVSCLCCILGRLAILWLPHRRVG